MTADCVAPICANFSLPVAGPPTVGWSTAVWLFIGVVACLALLILLVMFDAVPLIYLVVGGVATYFVWTQYGWPAGITAALVAVALSVIVAALEP
jgi:hypothetical protein